MELTVLNFIPLNGNELKRNERGHVTFNQSLKFCTLGFAAWLAKNYDSDNNIAHWLTCIQAVLFSHIGLLLKRISDSNIQNQIITSPVTASEVYFIDYPTVLIC